VLIAFSLVQMVWPLLAVSANALSVELVPAARGESVGLFNAATAVASSLGSAIGGVIFGVYGFSALAASAFVAVGVGALALGDLVQQAAPCRRQRRNGVFGTLAKQLTAVIRQDRVRFSTPWKPSGALPEALKMSHGRYALVGTERVATRANRDV
jgi:MFS family permease